MRPRRLLLLLLPARRAGPGRGPGGAAAAPTGRDPGSAAGGRRGRADRERRAAAAAVARGPAAEAGPPRRCRLPDGVTADLVCRPLPYLRLQAGPAWNYLACGMQGGVAVTPFRWAVSPVLEASYGHFFGADLNRVFKNVPAELQPLRLGRRLRLLQRPGRPRARLAARPHLLAGARALLLLERPSTAPATVVKNQGTPDEATVTVANPSLRAVIPSLRLGLLYYF